MTEFEKLNERIEQLTELVKSGSEAIKSMETALKAAEEERDRLADQRKETEPKFERMDYGHEYYSFGVDFEPFVSTDVGNIIDDWRYENNVYFHTMERAEEVADKIRLLLKLERLHDIYCLDYIPDWNDWRAKKWEIDYENSQGRYRTISTPSTESKTAVYFPTEEIAQKVCDILNAELEEVRDILNAELEEKK